MATITAHVREAAGLGADPTAAAQREARLGQVLAVGASHATNDFYASFLSPLLPLFISSLALTKSEAGLLSVFYQGPSLLQPIIGHLADRRNLRILVILAPAVTGIAMCLLGIAPSYLAMAGLLVIAGLSSAGVHAVGAPLVGELTARRLGRGMSIWMVCGELGFAIGATAVVTAISLLTIRGIPWLAVGGLLMSLLAYRLLRNLPARQATEAARVPVRQALAAMRPVLVPIAVIVVLRSFLDSAATIFLPTFLTGEGSGLWFAGASLSAVEVAGVAGVLLAGSASDRAGRRRVLGLSLVLAPACMVLFLLTGGALRFLLLLALGATLFGATPVIMAIVQGSFPESRALASGIYMAVAFALRSGVVVLVGLLGDLFGMRSAFYISALVSLLALPVMFFLPGPRSYSRSLD